MMNPFITYGYESAEYFCDRKEETRELTTLWTNGNHVALISPRRMGKTSCLFPASLYIKWPVYCKLSKKDNLFWIIAWTFH